MWLAKKAQDLRRDPRFSLHSGSDDPPAWKGDARVSGISVEIMDRGQMAKVFTHMPDEPVHLFRADITELVVVSVRKKMVIDAWHHGKGLSHSER